MRWHAITSVPLDPDDDRLPREISIMFGKIEPEHLGLQR
jgi:hypothetical protein